MSYKFDLNKKPNKSYTLKIGKIFLYDNFIVTEFNEGEDLNFETFNEVAELILLVYRNKPFGFIAKRTHSYSIKLKDVLACNKAYKNLKAYAIVTQNSLTEDIVKIENQFFNFNRKVFNDLDSAKFWVEETLNKENRLVLN